MAQKYFPETRHFLSGGFYDYWMKDGEDEGVYRYGYPISEEYHDELLGCTVQYFERARFEHRPDIANNEQHVVLGRLGWEYVDVCDLAEGEFAAFFEDKAETPDE